MRNASAVVKVAVRAHGTLGEAGGRWRRTARAPAISAFAAGARRDSSPDSAGLLSILCKIDKVSIFKTHFNLIICCKYI